MIRKLEDHRERSTRRMYRRSRFGTSRWEASPPWRESPEQGRPCRRGGQAIEVKVAQDFLALRADELRAYARPRLRVDHEGQSERPGTEVERIGGDVVLAGTADRRKAELPRRTAFTVGAQDRTRSAAQRPVLGIRQQVDAVARTKLRFCRGT